MADYEMLTINDFTYPDVFGMYNESGNTQSGILHNGQYIDDPLPGQETGIYFHDMLHFNLDASGTDRNNPKIQKLFELSNGVTINMSYYHDSTTGIVWYQTYYEGVNGNDLKFSQPYMGNVSGAYHPSQAYPYNNFSVYFNPFGCNYADYTETNYPHPDQIYTTTLFFQNPQPDFPNMNGFMEEEDVNRHFSKASAQLISDEQIEEFLTVIQNAGDGSQILPKEPNDDTSGPGGGDGDYNPFSDPIGHPELPISGGDAISTGFVRVYNPSTSQLRMLAGKLWSDDFFNTIKKINNDPMEAVISLHSIPFGVSTVSGNCVVGNYDSQIPMPSVVHQFVSKSLGSFYIPEHWGSALDYSPYVVVDCFIPFVGVRSLQVDDAIGKTISINANVDIITGATIITVMCGNSVLYAWNTNVITKHPITMSSMGPLYQSILGMAGNVINGAVAGGIGGAVGGVLGSAVNVAMSKHSQISRGGAIAGNAGALGHFTPYLIIHRPKQSLASGFGHFKGYPSNITATIDSVSGYSEIESVHLTGIPCTDSERDEIMALLYNGVIV